MTIEYKVNEPITTEQFVGLLIASGLSARRPVADQVNMAGRLAHGTLLVTAWDGDRLVGVARSITDFHACCYLADLAVDEDYQRQGVGRSLQALTQEQLGPQCDLLLLAAPAADAYYGHVGFTRHERCWILGRHQRIKM